MYVYPILWEELDIGLTLASYLSFVGNMCACLVSSYTQAHVRSLTL